MESRDWNNGGVFCWVVCVYSWNSEHFPPRKHWNSQILGMMGMRVRSYMPGLWDFPDHMRGFDMSFFPLLIGHKGACVGRHGLQWAPFSTCLLKLREGGGEVPNLKRVLKGRAGEELGSELSLSFTFVLISVQKHQPIEQQEASGFFTFPYQMTNYQGFSFDESYWAMIFSLQDDDLIIRQLSVQCGLPVPYL